MKIKKLLISILITITFILEMLPNGVVLNFANPEGESWRRTYSYFNLIPFGYANFAPFITALLTVVLIILLVISLIKKSPLTSAFRIISSITAVISLAPMLYGFDYVTATGISISILLSFCFVLSLLKN